MDYIIQANNISRCFPVPGSEDFFALSNVNVEIKKNSLTIFRGRSGSGKTTLVNILGLLDKPTSGNVIFNGKDLSSITEKQCEKIRRTKIGYVFQSVSLIPIMTAQENVEFALRLAGYNAAEMKKRAQHCLAMVGLTKRAHHMPQEMSGGEQQRVAIARAMAHKPSILFADEPTAQLDTATSMQVMELFKKLVDNENVTVVMTTHDVGLMGMGSCVYELKDGRLTDSTEAADG